MLRHRESVVAKGLRPHCQRLHMILERFGFLKGVLDGCCNVCDENKLKNKKKNGLCNNYFTCMMFNVSRSRPMLNVESLMCNVSCIYSVCDV